ncbi:MAG: NAD-binding protein, partial [Clostridium sp.]|nr:NAD-binding protein [Clostridium sp.]
MNIIIVGAGKVGYTLAKYLSTDGDNITIID